MFAQVYYFEEWRSWAVTLYDAQENRTTDEAEWWHLKSEAVASAEAFLSSGVIDRYEVFTRDGRHERTVARIKTGIKETTHP